ncbi:response regulator transcription factor [Dactylosporangium sp. CA-139066]|uniref:response regulator transcription factor n=1 Tax=Dactylosporangium sp. CA-139066 TaxID=3239930 RepID=UPI003D90886F
MSTSTEMLRIGLIDDRPLYREGLKEILVAIDDFAVIGQADDVDHAADIMRDEKPDVILLQVRSSDGVPTAAVRQLRASFSDSRIIILGMDDCPGVIYCLSSLDISGYLTNITRHGLVAAIRCVVESDNSVLLSVSREALNQMPAVPSARPTLTPRELEILSLTSQALSNTQIARQTFLSEATVKRHLRNIFTKLGAVSRIDAVNKAVAAALLPPPPHGTTVASE